MIKVDQQYFELIEEYRECFDEEIFSARYSDILDKYDYVVGDYGYDQLRLKGFYKDSNKKAEISKRFSSIQDYILEYCNFGCPYFVVRRCHQMNLLKKWMIKKISLINYMMLRFNLLFKTQKNIPSYRSIEVH